VYESGTLRSLFYLRSCKSIRAICESYAVVSALSGPLIRQSQMRQRTKCNHCKLCSSAQL
jgi:hypothetical protein